MSRRLADTRAAFAAWRAEQATRRAQDHPSLLDTPEETTEAAIQRSRDGTPSRLRAEAYAAVERAATRARFLTVDDVRDELEAAGQADYFDLRALGPVLRQAARAGVVVATTEYAPSRRRHSSPLRVWRSLRYRDGVA